MRAQQEKTLADERKVPFQKAQDLWSQHLPMIPVVAERAYVAANKKLGNFQPVPIQPYATWNAELLFFKK